MKKAKKIELINSVQSINKRIQTRKYEEVSKYVIILRQMIPLKNNIVS
jgi:hypothetical protein